MSKLLEFLESYGLILGLGLLMFIFFILCLYGGQRMG